MLLVAQQQKRTIDDPPCESELQLQIFRIVTYRKHDDFAPSTVTKKPGALVNQIHAVASSGKQPPLLDDAVPARGGQGKASQGEDFAPHLQGKHAGEKDMIDHLQLLHIQGATCMTVHAMPDHAIHCPAMFLNSQPYKQLALGQVVPNLLGAG